jgi:hypothetical protein
MPEVQKSTIYFPDRAPVQVSLEVKLKASPEQVWNVLIDNLAREAFRRISIAQRTVPVYFNSS